MERWLPDAFIFVLILTILAFAAAILVEGNAPLAVVQMWGDGFWKLLDFSMQMLLVLVTGYILASSPPVKRLLEKLAGLASSAGSAIILVTVVSMAASWINWGFGLVVGAIFAKELARQIKVDYRLLVASAYSGFVIWHGGLSGSIPLTIATPGHFSEAQLGVIPTSQTIFASWNLIICAALFIIIPIVNRMMMPTEAEAFIVPAEKLQDAPVPPMPTNPTPAEHMENNRPLMWIIAAMGIAWLVQHFVNAGGLNLNVVNFLFLFVGILLHGTARSFLGALDSAIRGGAGIVVQFPFYAGIMAIIVGSGLGTSLSEFFVSISTTETLPFWTFIAGGIINIFVPSGGGQWAVQAPVMLPAAQALGADMAKVAMGVAWGDAWTNMLQPFWALPMLGIAGLKARDIMGYCVVVLLASGLIIGLGLYFL